MKKTKTSLIIPLFLLSLLLFPISGYSAHDRFNPSLKNFDYYMANTCILQIINSKLDGSSQVYLVQDMRTKEILVKKTVSNPMDSEAPDLAPLGSDQEESAHRHKKLKCDANSVMIENENACLKLLAEGDSKELTAKTYALDYTEPGTPHLNQNRPCPGTYFPPEVLRPKRKELVIFMEHVIGPDLFDLVKSNTLKELEIPSIFAQIVMGIASIHQKNIAHRDLKLENIILTRRPNTDLPQVKIIDFGLSHIFSEDNPNPCPFVGSPATISPEVLSLNSNFKKIYEDQGISNIERPSKKVDIWALGNILYTLNNRKFIVKQHDEGRPLRIDEILTNTAQLSEGDLLKMVQKHPWTDARSPLVPPEPKSWQDLFIKIMKIRPQERPSLQEILDHPWLKVYAHLN